MRGIRINHLFGGERGKLAFAFLAAFAFLVVCSRNSFLYPMNDSVDVQCFFTLGRGMKHGLTPYLNLYEQKGPVLYFLYWLAALVSEQSFLGAFLLEIVCLGTFLYFSGRTGELLTGQRGVTLPVMLLTGLMTTVTKSFAYGGGVEEFSLPALSFSLFAVMRAMRERRPLSLVHAAAVGLCAGAVFWAKYTICGFYFGLALAVLIWYLRDGYAARLPGVIAAFLGGFLAVSVVVVAAFALAGALPALWEAYFYNNIMLYGEPLRRRFFWLLFLYFVCSPWVWITGAGVLWLFFHPGRDWRHSLATGLSGASLLLFILAGKRPYAYYMLPFFVFLPIGIATLLKGAARVLAGRWRPGPRVRAAALAVALVVSVFAALKLSPNTFMLLTPKEEMPQYRFAAEMRQRENPTLLNYGFLDGGFYYAANLLPTDRFFCLLNIPLPEMDDAQRKTLEEGAVDFVVTRDQTLEQFPKYREIDAMDYWFEKQFRRYRLYQLDER